MNIWS